MSSYDIVLFSGMNSEQQGCEEWLQGIAKVGSWVRVLEVLHLPTSPVLRPGREIKKTYMGWNCQVGDRIAYRPLDKCAKASISQSRVSVAKARVENLAQTGKSTWISQVQVAWI